VHVGLLRSTTVLAKQVPLAPSNALSTKQNTKKRLQAVIFLFLCTLVRSARPKNQRFSGLSGFRPINEAKYEKVPASSHFFIIWLHSSPQCTSEKSEIFRTVGLSPYQRSKQ
jgi:hypothetical protein